MNERIKKLAYLAEDYADSIVDQGGEFHETYTKKLAELIVKECAGLFEIEWGDEKLTGNDVGYVVKKHFGVEL